LRHKFRHYRRVERSQHPPYVELREVVMMQSHRSKYRTVGIVTGLRTLRHPEDPPTSMAAVVGQAAQGRESGYLCPSAKAEASPHCPSAAGSGMIGRTSMHRLEQAVTAAATDRMLAAPSRSRVSRRNQDTQVAATRLLPNRRVGLVQP